MEIISVKNTKIKQWVKYHQKKYRDSDKRFLIEGEHLIEEALRAHQVEVLLVREGCKMPFLFDGETHNVSDAVIHKLSQNTSLVDYMAVCIQKDENLLHNDFVRVALLDGIQDPGNLGTIIRSAYSFGFDAICLGMDCVDVYNEKVLRSTQGAVFHLPLIRQPLLDTIKELHESDFQVYATALQDSEPLSSISLPKKVAIIFGNEGSGVSEMLITQADKRIKIEMSAFESLNVGVAASICMYYFRRD